MRYSLAKYILTITIPANLVGEFGTQSISVGGENSYLESINITFASTLWETAADSTGSWVHNQNLDRSGTVVVNLNQLSVNVAKFKRLCNLFFNSNAEYDGLTLELADTSGNIIATCNDCLVQKIPDQSFQSTAQYQSWTFTCGKITIN